MLNWKQLCIVGGIGLMQASCAESPTTIKTALRCPALPSDLAAEANRKPTIKGTAALEVSGWLIGDIKRKNYALIRSIKLYNACRNT